MTILPRVDVQTLRSAIQEEYAEVATCPTKGFHFHTGRRLAEILGYPADRIDAVAPEGLESFAGVGNPFALGLLWPGERVLDAGSGSGFDSLIAARMVAPDGTVLGIDMTDAMLDKARLAAERSGLKNAEFRKGYIEDLPVPAESIDVVISNGVINLCLDKTAAYRELYRVLKPGGRLQIADILVQREVPLSAKEDIALWTG